MRRNLCSLLGCAAVLGSISALAWADEFQLKDGTVLEGTAVRLPALLGGPARPEEVDAPVPRSIWLISDDLRRTFIHKRQVVDMQASAAFGRLERFRIPQPGSRGVRQISSVGPAIDITPWDEFGRRTFSMAMDKSRRIDIIQGITEIDARVAVVEARQYLWETRVATASIPKETLDQILRRVIDPDDPNHRLRIASFYIQGRFYREARRELEGIREQFPDLSESVDGALTKLRQAQARDVLTEIQLRSTAGQHRHAIRFLEQFPQEGVAGAVLLEVRSLLQSYQDRLDQGRKTVAALREQLDAIPQGELRASVEPLVEEIAGRLNIENMSRMEAFLTFVEASDLEPHEKLATAVTGWLMGSDAAETELKLGLSLWQARDLAMQYLREDQFVNRQELLTRLRNIEGVSPERVAKIVEHLPPPLAPEVDHPGDVQHLRVTEGSLTFQYDVLLPPEYFTDRRYPAVITLHGAGSTCEMQLDWWKSQAERYGYIVIAPEYTAPEQMRYGYSAEEHAVVIASLRDALKRYQIDSDRVFLSGHSMGGTAAWDIGLSHPHLFAGVIPIVPYPDKYCRFYTENAAHLPFYIVGGQKDGKAPGRIAAELDGKWISRNDVRYVEYIGRGHEHFLEEIHRIFDWMQRRRRVVFPDEFDCRTLRRSDDRFYWVQLDSIPEKVALAPALFDREKRPTPMHVRGRVYSRGSINVSGAGASDLTLWLAPELVDFQQRVQLRVNGRSRFRGFVEPSLHDMLEDVRVRGDRQHFYWKKFSLAAAR